MAELDGTHTGAIVSLLEPYEDHESEDWVATQMPLDSSLPPGDDSSQRPFTWDNDPVIIDGYVQLKTLDLVANVQVAGVSAGNIHGKAPSGVCLKINFRAAKGELKLFLKNGDEIWVSRSIQISSDAMYDDQHKITTL